MNGKINYDYRITSRPSRQTSNTSLSFVDLKPKTYIISIKSQNEDGVWSEEAAVSFRIKQAWWQSWWFYTLITLGLFAIGYLFYRYRTGQLKKQLALQTEMQSLEKAALKSQMNPHFIFNCLNSIQNFIMQNDKLAAMDYLTKFANLIRLTLNASAENEISLHDEIKILENYLALEKLRFKNKFDYKISVESTINKHDILLPPMLIQPLVENAIKHGMKDIQNEGQIHISFQEKEDKLHILVKDNGKGFRKSTSDAGHKSLGMSITNRRLDKTGVLSENINVRRDDGWTVVEVWV